MPTHPHLPAPSTSLLRPPSRRTVAKGIAWATPTILVASQPAAWAGVSQCSVGYSVSFGPTADSTIRAVCYQQSQQSRPKSILEDYGVASMPTYLEICNCQNEPAYYRWRETDTMANFQIEVDGVHVDENSSASGYRAPFLLDSFGTTGGCKRYSLGYRTSHRLSTAAENLTIRITLQRSTSGTADGPWTDVNSLAIPGTVRRTTETPVEFRRCPSAAFKTNSRSATGQDSGQTTDGTAETGNTDGAGTAPTSD